MDPWVLVATAASALVLGAILGWLWSRRTTPSRLLALSASVVLLLLVTILVPRGTFSSCVAEGTPIATPTGAVPVERLRLGDRVLGRGADGATTAGVVIASRMAVRNDHLSLILDDGSELEVTAEHPVASGNRWVQAGMLRCGDVVETLSGPQRVARVGLKSGPVRVYDIEVDSCANFFAAGFLVHNKKWLQRIDYDTPEAKAIVGNWIGWDTSRGTFFVRLELAEGGKGRCVLWNDVYKETTIKPVLEWVRDGNAVRIEIGAEAKEPRVRLKGEVTKGMLMLESYGDDDNWRCHLQLVEERVAERVSAATRVALAGAPPETGR